MPPTLEAADAALARWRDRLAAASRNVSELSELPAYNTAKQAASGTGRLAAEARGLVATMNELWQGVLLIGAALDRADQARRGGSRLWRGDEAAAETMAILDGASIRVDLTETPVLHRSLLGDARATATVSPSMLLQTMEAAFDSARQLVARIGEAAASVEILKRRLMADAATLPGDWASRVAAADRPDALEHLDALQALRPTIEAALHVNAAIASARQELDALTQLAAHAMAAAAECRRALVVVLPTLDGPAGTELAAWLDRIVQTLSSGRTDAAQIGLMNWQAAFDRASEQALALSAATTAATARLVELRARLRLLRTKRRAHPGDDAVLDRLDQAAEGALEARPCDIDVAVLALRAYQAALAH